MKQLGIIDIGTTTRNVLVVRPEESEGNLTDDDEGAHDPLGGRIFISDDIAEASRVRETGRHEMVHAWIEHSGVKTFLIEECGIDPERWPHIEETIVGMLTPAVSSSWESATRVFDVLHISDVLGIAIGDLR